MTVVSLCFSLTLDPWRYNTTFWLLILFIKQICYWTKAKIRWLWFDYENNQLVTWFSDFFQSLISEYCKVHCCDNQILKISMVSCWFTQTSRIIIWISTMVTIKKVFMLGAMDTFCIMLVPCMHCSMSRFF